MEKILKNKAGQTFTATEFRKNSRAYYEGLDELQLRSGYARIIAKKGDSTPMNFVPKTAKAEAAEKSLEFIIDYLVCASINSAEVVGYEVNEEDAAAIPKARKAEPKPKTERKPKTKEVSTEGHVVRVMDLEVGQCYRDGKNGTLNEVLEKNEKGMLISFGGKNYRMSKDTYLTKQVTLIESETVSA